MTAELNSANEIMQELPSQLNGMNELYSAITGYNQNLERIGRITWQVIGNTRWKALGCRSVVALYDGIIRFLYAAIAAVERGDEDGRRAAVKRALDIIIHLQARLRMDVGGRPAQVAERVLRRDLRADSAGIAVGLEGRSSSTPSIV